jgi:penicillin amidase
MTMVSFAILSSLALGAGSSLDDPAPRDEGSFPVAGLTAPVIIERDSIAVPVIRAQSLADAARGLGFIHAQERFFQMDLARRYSAGELAELVGPQILANDERMRPFEFRRLAREVLARLPAGQREQIAAYTEGVNAGLKQSVAPPLEYTFLRAAPAAWRDEDCLLVMYSFFDALHFTPQYEKRLAVMQEALPTELFEFLTPVSSRFDAPLLPGGDRPLGENDYTPAPIPGPDVIDLRGTVRHSRARGNPASGHAEVVSFVDTAPPLVAGSNNWAIAGARTPDGRAILANDPHLQLSAPGVWYRAELRTTEHFLAGLTLPGLPGIVIGTNGHVAWGFTNTTADFQDYIIIEVDPDDPSRYRTPDGWEPFEIIEETIAVKGAGPRTLRIQKTRWGAVTDRDARGRPLVLKWTALDPSMVNLEIMEMADARSVDDAVLVARTWYGPSQNVLIADDAGRIAWVVCGYLPNRAGFTGKVPVSWADGTARWDGPLPEALRPAIIDPEEGVLFTANNRTIPVECCPGFSSFWDLGTRASRIGEMLNEGEGFLEPDLFEMQLDTRIEVFDLYRELAITACARTNGDELVTEAEEIVRGWNGTADLDQPALRILESFRNVLRSRVFTPLVAACAKVDPSFRYRWWMDEEPLRRLLEERPMHLLSQQFQSWDELIDDSFRAALVMLTAPPDGKPLDTPWGETNRADIQHPAAMAAPPAVAGLLGMPHDPLPGHHEAVRVSAPSFGASARLVVSPGREIDAILHIPTGQSGHPLSPHYRDSQPAWVSGAPTPLLSQQPVRVMRLVPD